MEKRRLYALDFDGTLTTKDTLIEIIRYAKGGWGLAWCLLKHLPWLVLMKMGLADNGRVKERVFSHCFRGMTLDDFNDLCLRFAADRRHLLRQKAVELLRQATSEGAEVAVVSASVDNWVQPFVPMARVIGTRVEVEDGKLTGRFATPNCYGGEKVRRLIEVFPDRESCYLVAYGDSRGDRELLAFADEAHYKPFVDRSRSRSFGRLVSCLSVCLLGLWLLLLNGLVVARHYASFSQVKFKTLSTFVGEFKISGYDPLSYNTLTYWHHVYDVHRHPLLTFMLYPLSALNEWLTSVFGVNSAQFIMAFVIWATSMGCAVMLYRLFMGVIGLHRFEALLLVTLFCSFAYTMISMSVPDHFVVSTLLLLLTLYISGRCMKRKKPFASWQTALLLLVSAGVTLTNGVKVIVASLFVRGHRFFRWPHLLLAIVLPCALLWGMAEWQYDHYVVPREQKKQVKRQKEAREKREKAFVHFCDTTQIVDSLQRRAAFDRMMTVKDSIRKSKPSVSQQHAGTPIGKGQFLRWTDVSTPRMPAVIHNLCGEAMLLHTSHLLEDTQTKRPVVVKYRWYVSYVIVGLIVLLCIAGIWYGRHERLLWLALTWLGFDMLLHFGLGFGLNEVYIYSPHWLFIVPLAIAYLFKHCHASSLKDPRWLVAGLTLCLFVCNSFLYVRYLLS